MKKKHLAESTEEFDKRFDSGEDIHNLINLSKAKTTRYGKKVHITIDATETPSSNGKVPQ